MRYNSFIKIFLGLNLAFCSLLIGCKSDETNKKHAHEEEHEAYEEAAQDTRFATLTDAQIKAVNISFGKVEQKELTATLKANGLLRVPNDKKGTATSLYGGVIQNLNIEIGNKVQKGQVIATIRNPQFIQNQEEFLSLQSKIKLAEQELDRQKTLNAGSAGALKNLQSSTADLQVFKTRYAALKQSLRLMGIHPESLNTNQMQTQISVSSPISGNVSNIFLQIGSYVDPSTPIAEIVDNHSLHLDLQIFEKDLPKLQIGQTIHFTLTNNPHNEYDAKVFSIGTSFENESKTIAVHCNVIGDKKGLIDGMNVTGIVSLEDVTAPAVPDEAIVNADGKYYVFLVKTPHNAKDKTVTFEKKEVVKSVSQMGYTSVTFVDEIPATAEIVTKGAFFIHAKMVNTGEHEH